MFTPTTKFDPAHSQQHDQLTQHDNNDNKAINTYTINNYTTNKNITNDYCVYQGMKELVNLDKISRVEIKLTYENMNHYNFRYTSFSPLSWVLG